MSAEPKISLDQQIEEIEYELRQREEVYTRLVLKGKLRRAVADYHMTRMRAVGTTLRWFKRNEATIRAAFTKKAEP